MTEHDSEHIRALRELVDTYRGMSTEEQDLISRLVAALARMSKEQRRASTRRLREFADAPGALELGTARWGEFAEGIIGSAPPKA